MNIIFREGHWEDWQSVDWLGRWTLAVRGLWPVLGICIPLCFSPLIGISQKYSLKIVMCSSDHLEGMHALAQLSSLSKLLRFGGGVEILSCNHPTQTYILRKFACFLNLPLTNLVWPLLFPLALALISRFYFF